MYEKGTAGFVCQENYKYDKPCTCPLAGTGMCSLHTTPDKAKMLVISKAITAAQLRAFADKMEGK